MIQELIYTSAPQGLKPGGGGYCTVAMTDGMAPTLIDQLESLSGYRHVYQPQDPQAPLNPINYSCLKINVGGIGYTVLSRVADAGLDYTQRTNKIAHHLALDASECVAQPCGPAAALASPSFVTDTWQGPPRYLPRSGKVFPPNSGPAPCVQWEKLTHDAGWAGALVEAALRKQDAVVLFEPGMQLLPLVVEALALLEPRERWEVTFSTYFTKLPPGVECRWRFIRNGSDEAKYAARIPNTLIVQLGANAGLAPGGNYVQAARSGQPIHRTAAERQSSSTGGDSVVNLSQQRNATTPVATARGAEYDLALPASRGTGDSTSRLMQGLPRSSGFSPAYTKPPSLRPYFIGGGIVVALLLVCGALYLGMLANPPTPRAPKEQASLEEANKGQQKKQKPPEYSVPLVPRPVKEDTPPAPSPRAIASATPAPIPSPPPASSPPTPERKSDPQVAFADLEARKYYLKIPAFVAKSPGARPELEPLAQIKLVKPEDCELELIGAEDAFPSGWFVTLKLADSQPSSQRLWSLVVQPKGLGGAFTDKPRSAADLRLDGDSDELSFQWVSNVPESLPKESLGQCLLKVSVNGNAKLCRLSEPKAARPFRFTPSASSGIFFAEFKENDSRVEVPLLGPEYPNTSEKPTNPKLKIRFRYRMDDGNLIPGTSTKDGKGSQLNISPQDVETKNQAACRLDFALASVKQKNGTTLGVTVALSGQVYEQIKQSWESVEKPQLTPRILQQSYHNLDEALRGFEARLKTVEEHVNTLKDQRNTITTQQMAFLGRLEELKKLKPNDKDRADYIKYKLGELDKQLSELAPRLKTAEDDLNQNVNFIEARDGKAVLSKYQERQQALLKIRDRLTVHYTVYLDFADQKQEIVLYDTELNSSATTAERH